MPTTTRIGIRWEKFTNAHGSLVMSVGEFKEQMLWGIPLCNPVTGVTISDETIKQKLLAWQDMFESTFSLKLFKQYISETKDFIREEFTQWAFVKTNWQINTICGLQGRFNEFPIVTYPLGWLSTRRGNDGSMVHQLFVIPNSAGSQSFTYVATAVGLQFQFWGRSFIPNYWNIKYVTGFDNIPPLITNVIGIATAIDILIMAEQVVGLQGSGMFGMASQSLSFDGLSQSVSRANGGNIFQQRIKAYNEQLKDLLPKLKSIYSGVTFDVM